MTAPRAVAVAHQAGLAHGVAWQWPDSDLAVLMLHDLGGDLDDLRWIAEPLAAAGADVLSLDLPGHGLSDGEAGSGTSGGDTAAAITAAWELLTADPGRAACLLAEGRTAQLALGLDLAQPPVGAVLLAPSRPPDAQTAVAADAWTCVPKLIVAPDAGDGGYADDIVGATRAWCLRADLDRPARPPNADADTDADDQAVFATQVTSLTLKFLLEQAVFELARRNAGRPDGSA